ncbi:hypothetical protein SDC9_57109 [bioreactor metagenome]|uniref:Uncharacterized protein n=1 Tax=bioreactor metagenome TaxID=1076179 RepID=A0A644X9G3_9ZZZZ
MPVLAVHRDEELGFRQFHHQAQFLAAGVTGNMHVRHAVVNNLRAFLVELVDDAGNANLVARNGRGGDDDRVALTDIEAVRRGCHAEQPAHGLALAAGSDHADLVVAVAFELLYLDDALRRNLQVVQAHGNLHHLLHAAPLKADHAAVTDRNVRNLLDAVNVAGKGSNDDAPFRNVEIVFKRFANIPFALRVSRAFYVGAVAHQREHAARAVMRKADNVDRFAVDGRKVHLKVSGVNHRADGRVHRQRDRARD